MAVPVAPTPPDPDNPSTYDTLAYPFTVWQRDMVPPLNDALAKMGLYAARSGSANAIVLTGVLPPGVSPIPTGTAVRFRAGAANTGATTINLDGTGAVACRTIWGAALEAGDIITAADTVATYDGTFWVVYPAVARSVTDSAARRLIFAGYMGLGGSAITLTGGTSLYDRALTTGFYAYGAAGVPGGPESAAFQHVLWVIRDSVTGRANYISMRNSGGAPSTQRMWFGTDHASNGTISWKEPIRDEQVPGITQSWRNLSSFSKGASYQNATAAMQIVAVDQLAILSTSSQSVRWYAEVSSDNSNWFRTDVSAIGPNFSGSFGLLVKLEVPPGHYWRVREDTAGSPSFATMELPRILSA